VSETINLAGFPIVLTDTAGIEPTENLVERLGIERSRAELQRSDLLLVVLECGREPSADEWHLLAETAERPRLVVLNKSDLNPIQIPELQGIAVIPVSALTGEGLPQLEQSIVAQITGGRVVAADVTAVTNPRHKAAIVRARDDLIHARDAIDADLPEDLASADLRASIEALGEITGDTLTEDLLDSIFRNFCIGK
jgi:tRNA modification GTPase